MPENPIDDPPAETFDIPPRDGDLGEAGTLSVDVGGYEGPLDLLLALARTQKVDLREISILQLAEQYLEFVSAAHELRIELAADYLVTAAWLTYLKSRLLLPPPHSEDESTGEDMAARLAFRLERLEAMRKASAELMARDRLGRDFFARGMTETPTARRRTAWTATLSDLLKAYAGLKTREEYRPLRLDRMHIWTVEQALNRLKSMIGEALEWTDLADCLPEGFHLDAKKRRSAIASTFAASLELARRGEMEIAQERVFAPVYLRKRVAA